MSIGKILIVDEDTTSAFLITETLKKIGVATQEIVVSQGKYALQLLDNEPFDLVLLESNGQVMEGVEFLEKLSLLQEKKGFVRPKVVLLTTLDATVEKAKAANLPIDGFLIKPLAIQHLNYLLELTGKGAE